MTDLRWRRACTSASNCVEVAADGRAVFVRDRAGRVLAVTPAAWSAFLADCRTGRWAIQD